MKPRERSENKMKHNLTAIHTNKTTSMNITLEERLKGGKKGEREEGRQGGWEEGRQMKQMRQRYNAGHHSQDSQTVKCVLNAFIFLLRNDVFTFVPSFLPSFLFHSSPLFLLFHTQGFKYISHSSTFYFYYFFVIFFILISHASTFYFYYYYYFFFFNIYVTGIFFYLFSYIFFFYSMCLCVFCIYIFSLFFVFFYMLINQTIYLSVIPFNLANKVN